MIPYTGIFGALGSDVAILRIGAVQGELALATNVLETTKIGDRVRVVRMSKGGGVPSDDSGKILGIGPARVEVDANFSATSSGGPILNLRTNEVVGIASYAENRTISTRFDETVKRERRWFGFRLDNVAAWEAIDLARWKTQADRVEVHRAFTEALVAGYRFQWKEANKDPKVRRYVADLLVRLESAGTNRETRARHYKDFFQQLRALAEGGLKDLTPAEFYDYYRTCLSWENNVPQQIEYRTDLISAFKSSEADIQNFIVTRRGGG